MNEYADRLAIDVVSAPLAEIDRRTLSQAWYSALHLARDAAPSSAPLARDSNARPPAMHAARPRDPGARAVPARAAGGPGSSVETNAIVDGRAERRRPPSFLAKKIERALVRPQASNRRATLTVQGGTGRIALLVRSCGTTTHVIAVCSPSAHARVARALEHARFALARRGVVLAAQARGATR